MRLFLFYTIRILSFAVVPILLALIWAVVKARNKGLRIIFILGVLGSLLFVEMRYVEPYFITTEKTSIETKINKKVVLVGDMHVGVYKGKYFVKRLAKRINRQDPDYIMFAGDFLYAANESDVRDILSPLQDIEAEAYAVLGNHDYRHGEPAVYNLINLLEELGIEVVTQQVEELDGFTLVGIDDNWYGDEDVSILDALSEEKEVVVLTHNPDTTLNYTNDIADITLCGHTHGGQMRVPFLYKRVIPTKGEFDRGLAQMDNGSYLYITSGVGEIGFPLRFLNPARIEVIEI